MRKILLSFFLALAIPLALGQGVFVPTQTAFKVVNGYTTPIANATITVCAANTGGIPCSPVLVNAIFKDTALTQPLSNPFTSDALGNYQFAATAGAYTVTVTALGFVGSSYQVSTGGSGGTLTIPNPLNATNLNVSGTTNMNGFSSTGPGNWSQGFPAFGAPADPFCGYMVTNLWWQLCGITDPNNGTTVLAFNDGIGTPNINNFVMATDTLPSSQASGAVPCWNPATQAFSFSVICTLPVLNINSGGPIPPNTRFNVQSQTASVVAQFIANQNASSGVAIELYGSRGTSALPTATLSTDTLGQIGLGGWDGSNYGQGVGFIATAGENWNPTSHGSGWCLLTIPTGSLVASKNLCMLPAGNLGLGVVTPAAEFAFEMGAGSRMAFGLPNSAVTSDSDLLNGQGSFYVNESSKLLLARIKFSDSSLHTLTLPIDTTQLQPVLTTSFTTTAAASDNVTVTGVTASSHCSLTPTNTGAAGGIASVYISGKGTNVITVVHTATSGWTFDVMCTPL